ncbi:MAG: lysoplasmalogenase [Bacteroidota bacterium]
MMRMNDVPFFTGAPSSLRPFTMVYLSIAALEITARILENSSFAWLEYVIKPLIMLSLLTYFLLETRGDDLGPKWFMVGAMAFSLFGDVLLMFSGPQFFLLGLGGFLIAHICYIIIFLRPEPEASETPMLLRKPWLVMPFLIYGSGILIVLVPHIGSMAAPVVVYALVITAMGLAALNRWKRVPIRSFGMVFLGALLFIISDTIIALNRFLNEDLPIPLASLWIMLTYMAAQYLIVIGILRQWWESKLVAAR